MRKGIRLKAILVDRLDQDFLPPAAGKIPVPILSSASLRTFFHADTGQSTSARKRWRRGLCGRSKIASGVPASTTRPSSMNTT